MNSSHTVHVPARDMNRLRDWLSNPNGSFSLGRVTLEAVEGGSILIRTRSWDYGDKT